MAQKGTITTVEGYLLKVSASLDEHIRSIVEAMMEQPSLSIQLSTGEVKSAGDYIHVLTSIKENLYTYISGSEVCP